MNSFGIMAWPTFIICKGYSPSFGFSNKFSADINFDAVISFKSSSRNLIKDLFDVSTRANKSFNLKLDCSKDDSKPLALVIKSELKFKSGHTT